MTTPFVFSQSKSLKGKDRPIKRCRKNGEDSIRYRSSYGTTSPPIRTTMAKYQVLFTLLAISAALSAPVLPISPSEHQKADNTAALLYHASYPYHYGVHNPAAAPYAYTAAMPAVAPAVVAAPYAHGIPAEPLVHPLYTSTVKVLPAPATYAYVPARNGYAHGQATPNGYSYTHVSRGW